MNSRLEQIQQAMQSHIGPGASRPVALYPGIWLYESAFSSDSFSLGHEPLAGLLQINYCRAGQIEWRMREGAHIYLNPGDFSLHTMETCAESTLSFPTGRYEGLTICLDLDALSVQPPEPLGEIEGFPRLLREKFCRDGGAAFLAGGEGTESIFSAFYSQPEPLAAPYRKVKTLELFLYLLKVDFTPRDRLTAYQSEQVELIRAIHDDLIQNIGRRITIAQLSRQYLVNPTTLKTAFKAVYGTSIAAHIKAHRMERAAQLLREGEDSIAEIAQAVGYDSQSKFSAAFQAAYGVLPKEFRREERKRRQNPAAGEEPCRRQEEGEKGGVL